MPVDPRLSTALANRYRIQHKLGEGGMATVYLAHDLKHDRSVALKVLRPELAAVIGAERFLHEIRVTANLQHPNIVQLYDSGEVEGLLYYVMPAVEGESLADKLRRETQLGIDEAVTITQSVADALDYAHRRGVIHRDIKPENILLFEGKPMVTDFGIALAATRVAGERITQTGLSLGTPAYMSPEQATGDRELTARTDVYSLGSVLYEMLAGDPPFAGTNVQAVIAKVIGEQPAKLRTIRDTVPEHIEAVVNKALVKVPADRFESARAFADALQDTTFVATVEVAKAAPASWMRKNTVIFLTPFVAAAAAVLVWRAVPDSPIASATIIRPITRFDGWEYKPSWSPDGTQIAYTHTVGGDADIATLSLGGGDPFILTDESPWDDIAARWSPNGSKIAFVSDRGAGTDVYWIPPSGGTERKMAETRIPALERLSAWAGSLGSQPWSPDDQELLFSRLQENGDIALWKVNVTTGEETQLTFPPPGAEDVDASWSFDGESIAFTREDKGSRSVWILPVGSGEPSLFLGDKGANVHPAWFPDNRRLVFVSTRGGGPNLWEVDVRTKALRQLTASAVGNDAVPVVARNGAIAYGNWDHQIDIHWMWRDSSERQHEKITTFTGSNFAARISPDGNRVVYASNSAGPGFHLWLFDRTRGQHHQLRESSANERLPDWSPDGREIVFLSDSGGAVRLWVINAETGVVRLLADHALPWRTHVAEAGGPRWAPDGSAIGFIAPADEGNVLWLVEPDGANPRPSIVRGAFSFSWYRDGQRVVYTRRAAAGSRGVELRAANLVTGEDRLLLSGDVAEVEVSADGSMLSFVESVSHFTMNLQVAQLTSPSDPNGLPVAVGEPQQVTFGGGVWHVHNGGWTPDGSAAVYSRDRDWGDIYVIESNQ